VNVPSVPDSGPLIVAIVVPKRCFSGETAIRESRALLVRNYKGELRLLS